MGQHQRAQVAALKSRLIGYQIHIFEFNTTNWFAPYVLKKKAEGVKVEYLTF